MVETVRDVMTPRDGQRPHRRRPTTHSEEHSMTFDTTATPIRDVRRDPVAEQLSRLLAATHALYQKTLDHWNVTGPDFPSLHQLFEQHYRELQEATDTVAERVRQLGAETPPFGRSMATLTSVPDDDSAPDAVQMPRALIDAREAVIATARDVVETAEKRSDVATVDIGTQLIVDHEKAVWTLRSTAS